MKRILDYQLTRKPSCVFRPSPAVEMTPAVTFEMFCVGRSEVRVVEEVEDLRRAAPSARGPPGTA